MHKGECNIPLAVDGVVIRNNLVIVIRRNIFHGIRLKILFDNVFVIHNKLIPLIESYAGKSQIEYKTGGQILLRNVRSGDELFQRKRTEAVRHIVYVN